MTYRAPTTDSDGHSHIDGVTPDFKTTVEAGAGGFGIRKTVKGVEVFEVLDAMPLNRAATQKAVEAGSSSAKASQSGVTAVDFATQNFLTGAEATAAAGIKQGEASAGDLT